MTDCRYARGMATYEVQAVREHGVWQVFIEGTPITEVLRWSSVGPVAREFLAMDREDEIAPSPYVRADVHMTLDLH